MFRHILWEKPSLNVQVKHFNIKLALYFYYCNWNNSISILIVNNFVYMHTIIQFIVTLTKAEDATETCLFVNLKLSSIFQDFRICFVITARKPLVSVTWKHNGNTIVYVSVMFPFTETQLATISNLENVSVTFPSRKSANIVSVAFQSRKLEES